MSDLVWHCDKCGEYPFEPFRQRLVGQGCTCGGQFRRISPTELTESNRQLREELESCKAIVETRTTDVSTEEAHYDAGKEVNLPRMIKRLQDERNCAAENFKVTNQAYVKSEKKVRELSEELEAVRSANDVLTERSVAAMDIADGDVKPSDFAKVENQCPMLSSVVKLKRKSIADTTALTAAKEALETAKLQMDPFEHVFEFIDNALARIAECEKETA